jgi:hypothetical protein
MSAVWRGLMLAAGAAVLAAVVAHAGAARVAAMLWQIGWGFALLAVLRAGYVALRAAALWRALPDGALSFRELWWIRLSTEAVEMFTLTGPFLAEPAKGWLLTRRGLSTAQAAGLVMLEFLLYTLITAWMAAAALSIVLARGLLSPSLQGPVVATLAGIGLATAAFVYAAASGTGLIAPAVEHVGNWFGAGRGTAAAARLRPAEDVLIAFLTGRRRRLYEVGGMLALAQMLITVEAWVVFRAVGVPATFAESFVFEGAVKFVDVVFFFIPGQLGAHEGFYSAMAGTLGILPAAGLTLALARRIRGVLVGSAAFFAVSTVTKTSTS